MQQDHFIGAGSFEHTASIICRWVLSALKAHVKVICQSVKANTPEDSCSLECICSEQMKEKIVCNKHSWKAKARRRLSVFCLIYLWPLLCYWCRRFARLSWLLLSVRKWRARELHLSWIIKGRSLWQVEEFQMDSSHFCLLPVQSFRVP